MNLDLLGTDPVNKVVGEEVNVTDNCIIVKRGFFFADTMELFDSDGQPLDENAYSYDLPDPALSMRMGRLIFGRIIFNGNTIPATADYVTPQYADDNRYDDLVTYHNYVTHDPSNDYYNPISRIFKTNVNVLDGSDTEEWLASLDSLIKMWRNCHQDYDIILDIIDEVFTNGIVRYPSTVDTNTLLSPSFITSTEEGNSLAFSKWGVDWTIDGNIFSIDYLPMRESLATLIDSVATTTDIKYGGTWADVYGKMQSSTGYVEQVPLKTMGTDFTNDVSIVRGTIYFNGNPVSEDYVKAGDLLASIRETQHELFTEYASLSNMDIDGVTDGIANLSTAADNGYTCSDIYFSKSGIVVLGNELSDVYTAERAEVDLANAAPTGTVVESGYLSTLQSKVSNLNVDVTELIQPSEKHLSLGVSTMEILDGMVARKETLNPAVGTAIDISEVL